MVPLESSRLRVTVTFVADTCRARSEFAELEQLKTRAPIASDERRIPWFWFEATKLCCRTAPEARTETPSSWLEG